jgi:hypothetical protein
MKTIITRTACAILAALVIVSCSEDEQPSYQTGRVVFYQDSVISVQWLKASLNDGQAAWSFEPPNFAPNPDDDTQFLGPQVETVKSGTLRMTFSLVRPDDFVFSSGAVDAPLSTNWSWTFDVMYSVGQPPITGDNYIKTSQFDVHDPAHSSGKIYVIWRGRPSQ